MNEASVRFRRWASSNGIEHSTPHFTNGLLVFDPYPAFTLKAYSGRIFLIFADLCLHAAAGQMPQDSELQIAAYAARCLCAWFDATERAGRYLSVEQAGEIETAGLSFLRAYQSLAVLALRSATPRWKLVPKHHAAWLGFEIQRS